jgi:putative nucleotidyltransferase with HDIG domain
MIMDHKADVARIKRITESIIGLPTLPTVVSKMIQLVDNPKTSAVSLARLISTDQALTARILKLANSAYYGFSGEISTVNMAIVVLGFNTVKDMGLSLSVFDVFKKMGQSKNFDISRFWEHSIACGVASRMLTDEYCRRYSAEAFVAGLLHDIGKVVLNQYFNKEFNEIMELAANGLTLDDAELQVLGTSHARIGAWLAEKWNLPKIISESLLYHHSPWESGKDQVLVALICFADYICHISGMGNSGRVELPILDEKIWEIFQTNGISLEVSDIESKKIAFYIEFDRAESFMTLLQNKG